MSIAPFDTRTYIIELNFKIVNLNTIKHIQVFRYIDIVYYTANSSG